MEDKPGNRQASPQNTIGTPAYVPNTATAIPQGSSPQAGHGLTGVIYNNTNASAQVVTIAVGGVAAYRIPLAATGAAGDSVVFTLPGGLANSASAITHVCGTASAVYATPIYGG